MIIVVENYRCLRYILDPKIYPSLFFETNRDNAVIGIAWLYDERRAAKIGRAYSSRLSHTSIFFLIRPINSERV